MTQTTFNNGQIDVSKILCLENKKCVKSINDQCCGSRRYLGDAFVVVIYDDQTAALVKVKNHEVLQLNTMLPVEKEHAILDAHVSCSGQHNFIVLRTDVELFVLGTMLPAWNTHLKDWSLLCSYKVRAKDAAIYRASSLWGQDNACIIIHVHLLYY